MPLQSNTTSNERKNSLKPCFYQQQDKEIKFISMFGCLSTLYYIIHSLHANTETIKIYTMKQTIEIAIKFILYQELEYTPIFL